MSITFIVNSALIVTLSALCIGTAIKFWHYGIRDLLLLSSPLVVILGFFVLPLLIFNMFIFHSEKLGDIFKAKKPNSKVSEIDFKNLSLLTRLELSFIVSFTFIRLYPLIVGAAASTILSLSNGKRDSWFNLSNLNNFIERFLQESMSMGKIRVGNVLKRTV
ncbi:hypothetical protein P4S95_17720 [Aneurinibacillus aneurinilyticus]|uniref:hypothetical protein n=1 Tax=Aneurinibacillus aneurinilyticus TaxID=1391 RepID=UPI002E220732|nr:hypothetical protein [Aneurinibacillus aneurinilyticus]